MLKYVVFITITFIFLSCNPVVEEKFKGKDEESSRPVITLIGKTVVMVDVDGEYVDTGATAVDKEEGDISLKIVIGGDIVNINIPGSYEVTYDVTDLADNRADTVTRIVLVQTKISINGMAIITLEAGEGQYIEEGAISDGKDISGPSSITYNGIPVLDVNNFILDNRDVGTYVLTYTSNFGALETRTVIVTDDTGPTIDGGDGQQYDINHSSFGYDNRMNVLGVSISDNSSSKLTIEDNFSEIINLCDVVNIQTYDITVTDGSGNQSKKTVSVKIVDDTNPTMSFDGHGSDTESYLQGDFSDHGVNVEDICFENTRLVTSSDVKINVVSVTPYEINYTYTDLGENSVSIIRMVTINEAQIVLTGETPIVLEAGDIYNEEGAIGPDGNAIASPSTITPEFNSREVGTYILTYSMNYNDIPVSKERRVIVEDHTGPTIMLGVAATESITINEEVKDLYVYYHSQGESYDYNILNISLADNALGAISIGTNPTSNLIDVCRAGANLPENYQTYDIIATDVNNNDSIRSVYVRVEDNTVPLMVLRGSASGTYLPGTFVDMEVSINDQCASSGTLVVDPSNFNDDVPGEYAITYTYTDLGGRVVSKERSVTITPADFAYCDITGRANDTPYANSTVGPIGDGTVENPFTICSEQQLQNIATYNQSTDAEIEKNRISKHFVLKKDLDFTDKNLWLPIGYSLPATLGFEGSLDGENHAISNLIIDRSTSDYVGLFARLNGATIKDLKLENFNVKGNMYVGVLTGNVRNGIKSLNPTTGESTVIENVRVTGTNIISGEQYVGGIAGAVSTVDMNYASPLLCTQINNTMSEGDINGNRSLGGLIGFVFKTCLNVTNSYSSVDVSRNDITASSEEALMGGLIGEVDQIFGEIRNCYASGNISGNSNINVQNSGHIGGLLGYVTKYSSKELEIHNVFAAGEVSNCHTNCGGFIGHKGNHLVSISMENNYRIQKFMQCSSTIFISEPYISIPDGPDKPNCVLKYDHDLFYTFDTLSDPSGVNGGHGGKIPLPDGSTVIYDVTDPISYFYNFNHAPFADQWDSNIWQENASALPTLK